MRYVVIGAGGIGGAVGGMLAHGGAEVLLVARGAHATAIAADGLHITTPVSSLVVRAPVSSVGDLRLQRDDVLLVAVKSYDTETVLSSLRSKAVDGGSAGARIPVILLQNGIANEPRALRYFAAVHGAAVSVSASFLEPGKVDIHSAPTLGLLEVGLFPGGTDSVDDRFVADMNEVGFGATKREDVMAWKRSKLLINLGNAGEIVLAPTAEGARDDDGVELIRRLHEEAHAVFRAAGLSFVADAERDAHLGGQRIVSVDGRVRPGSSTVQGYLRGTPTETDFLNGEIVLLGRMNGVATPANQAMQELMSAVAEGQLEPRSVPASRVLALSQAPAH